ncbi:hypothetical protein MMC34_005971 [Xylographa carneopallida]|nr:hypothetical protein [Xylographa carneopallida]
MSLGTLEKLPEEVRRLIWQHFVFPRTPASFKTASSSPACLLLPPKGSFSKSSERRLAVLGVSKQVHGEVTEELERYCNRHLVLETHPEKERIVVSNPRHLTFSDFENTDLSPFEELEISIYAPDTKDPGQLLHLRDLVELLIFGLRCSQTLPRVVIVLQETKMAHWHTGDGFNKSVPRSNFLFASPSENRFNDIEHVLHPFWIAGTAPNAEVRLPAVGPVLKEAFLEPRSTEVMLRKRNHESWERIVLNENITTTIFLHCELDQLEGPTASMLRLRRYYDWNTYHSNFVQIMGRHEMYSKEDFLAAPERHEEDRRFYMCKENGYDQWVGENDEEKWKSVYPAGIPSKRSDEWYEFFFNIKKG